MDISLDQAIKGFWLYNEAAGRSKNTYRWYEMNLRHFHRWLEKHSDHMPHLDEITAEDLRNYLSELRNLVEMAEKHPEQQNKNRVHSHRTIRGYYANLSASF